MSHKESFWMTAERKANERRIAELEARKARIDAILKKDDEDHPPEEPHAKS